LLATLGLVHETADSKRNSALGHVELPGGFGPLFSPLESLRDEISTHSPARSATTDGLTDVSV
jgi:hypothetical protein